MTPQLDLITSSYAHEDFIRKQIFNMDEQGFVDTLSSSTIAVQGAGVNDVTDFTSNATGNNGRTSYLLPGQNSNLMNNPTISEIDILFRGARGSAGTSSQGMSFFGITKATGAVLAATQTVATVVAHYGFIFYCPNNTTFEVHVSNANGSTQTVAIIAGIASNVFHSYRINIVNGTALFYIDGVLVATRTTNLPTWTNLNTYAFFENRCVTGSNAQTMQQRGVDISVKY